MKLLTRLNPFRLTVEKREAELLRDARMSLVEYEALSEHHAAMAALCRRRIERLEGRAAANEEAMIHYGETK